MAAKKTKVLTSTILVAPNPFKGTLSARQAASAMAKGLKRVLPTSKVIQMPLSDGGPGLVEALACLKGARLRVARVRGPVGRPVQARWLMLPGRRAVIESAQACGLERVKRVNAVTAWQADTYGVGQLMLAAKKAGAKELLIGLGGSASSDGGLGMWRCLREDYEKTAWSRISVTALCDVDNPLRGVRGAARVYAPQKGASPTVVRKIESRLRELDRRFVCKYGKLPRTGAGGGLGFGLKVFCRARLVQGAPAVFKLLNVPKVLARCQWMLTGEGRLDEQSLSGKLPVLLAKAARRAGCRSLLIAGEIKLNQAASRRLGRVSLLSLGTNTPLGKEKSSQGLKKKVEQWARAVLK